MTFVNALFLLLAAGVVGPILAHLLARPRFRRVPFTMLHFLQSGTVESESRRKLRNFLVLMLRCAIILLIVLAFAGPTFVRAAAGSSGKPTYLIGVDDSLSMSYAGVMPAIKEQVSAAIQAMPSDADISVFGLASGQLLTNVEKAAAAGIVQSLEPVALPAQLDAFLGATRAAVDEHPGAARILIASDFSRLFRRALKDSKTAIRVASAEAIRPNVDERLTNLAITDATIAGFAPDRIRVAVQVANWGTEAADTGISAAYGDARGDATITSLAEDQEQTVFIELPKPGESTDVPIEITIQSKDGLLADNTFYLGLNLNAGGMRRVLVVARDDREAWLLKSSLAALNEGDGGGLYAVRVMTYPAFDPNALAAADVIFAASVDPLLTQAVNELKVFVRGGGRLVLFAHVQQEPQLLATLFENELSPALPEKLSEHAAYIQLPAGAVAGQGAVTFAHDVLQALHNYRLDSTPLALWYACRASASASRLWPIGQEDALIYAARSGEGAIVFVNTSADDSLSSLMKSPAAVAFCSYLMDGGEAVEEFGFRAGESLRLPLPASSAKNMTVKTPAGAPSMVPVVDGTLSIFPVRELGWLTVESEPPLHAGINVPRDETDVRRASDSEVESLMRDAFSTGDATQSRIAAEDGTERSDLTRWALWAACALLVVEAFVANRMAR